MVANNNLLTSYYYKKYKICEITSSLTIDSLIILHIQITCCRFLVYFCQAMTGNTLNKIIDILHNTFETVSYVGQRE